MKSVWFDLPFRLAFIYAGVGICWILVSDQLVLWLAPNAATLTLIQTYKGWLFVGVSAVLLFSLVRFDVKRRTALATILVDSEKRTAQAVRENERQYRLLFEQNPMPMWVYDIETLRFLAVNDAAIAHYGFSRDEFLAITIKNISPDDDLPKPREWGEPDELGFHKGGAWRHRLKDGRIIDVDISYYTLDFDGRRAKLVMALDITDRKRAEASLRQSEEKLRLFIEHAPAALAMLDIDMRYLVVSRRWITDYPLSSYNIVGRSHDEILPEIPDRWKDAHRRGLQGEIIKADEDFFERTDGSKQWIRWEVRPWYRMDKEIGGILIFSEDITERKASEESLRRLQMAVEGSGDVVFMTDKDGTMTYINKSFTATYGFTSDEVVGKVTPRILKSGETPAESYRAMWNNISEGRQFATTIVNKTKDGRFVRIETSLNPIMDSNRNITGYLAIQKDVTARVKLESQLTQAQRLDSLGTLAGGIAHDFNNILGIILGYASYIKKYLGDAVRLREGVASIEEAVDRGKGVTRRLLTFARKTESVQEILSINEVIRNFIKLMSETFPKTIQVVVDLQEKIPPIKGDRTQLDQVLLNLFVNARDAMDGVGRITVSTTVCGGRELKSLKTNTDSKSYVRIIIRDTGHGMDESTKSRIFEPFFTTKESGGTGLGLAVTFGIIQSHHGLIDVETKPGKGSAFHIYLPVHAGIPSAVSPVISQKTNVTGTETVLLIEDEPQLRKLLGIILHELGYRVLSASNGDEGLGLFTHHENEIAIVVTDLDMPGMNGLAVAKTLNEKKSSLKIVVTSGYLDGTTREQARQYGVAKIMQKPYDPEDLARVIRELLDES
jgi:PAS domain S-box-containing protein